MAKKSIVIIGGGGWAESGRTAYAAIGRKEVTEISHTGSYCLKNICAAYLEQKIIERNVGKYG